ncbi:response regulator transcription factor [Planctomicrobium sp.]|jgi:DNA-binding response OmpR family regulator|nr:response regulator transcription factor [Planctomicrobium sp.]MBT5018876.1 response regulator transcription factor [Planctomicrobium sp.]MDB4731841.1 response regulator transcription factor [bacterium]MDB4743346.1 response regulator transcription factor [Planctomicrobium sp.]
MTLNEKKRILIVEDEEAIANGLRFNMEAEGYDPVVLGDGPATLNYFEENSHDVDLVILDLMLPGMSGYEICRAIRERDQVIPIIVLSARTLSEDKSHAFDCGTDQYITKPFNLPELLSRVRNLLKRPRAQPAPKHATEMEEFQIADVQINFKTYEVIRGEEKHSLTTMEMQLLRYFIENQGDVLSRTKILKDVWEQGAEVTSRTIDNFVLRLRKYIEEDPSNPRHLLSVRGTGYRFVQDT